MDEVAAKLDGAMNSTGGATFANSAGFAQYREASGSAFALEVPGGKISPTPDDQGDTVPTTQVMTTMGNENTTRDKFFSTKAGVDDSEEHSKDDHSAAGVERADLTADLLRTTQTKTVKFMD